MVKTSNTNFICDILIVRKEVLSITDNHNRTINALNSIDFQDVVKLPYADRKIIFSVISLLKQAKSVKHPQIKVQTSYLQHLSHNDNLSYPKFCSKLDTTNRQLVTAKVSINTKESNGQHIHYIPIFDEIDFSIDTQQVTLSINPQVLPYFTNLSANYFWFLLKDSNNIKSKQNLNLFIYLSHLRYKGIASISMENATKLLNCKPRYTSKNMKRSINKLSSYFKNLKFKPKYIRDHTGKHLSSYLITFNRESFHKSTIKSLSKDIKISDTDLPF